MIKQIIDSSMADISNAKILLVDDDPLNTAILSKSLELFDNVYSVHSGQDAIEFCHKILPDLVLLDVVMPHLDGHITCQILRTIDGMENCPIIFSTSLSGIEDEIKCWEAGGNDFVSKPVSPLTLLMRVQSHIRLKLQCDEHKSMAIFDSLTGLRNRHFFDGYYQQQIHLSLRNKTDLSLLVIDIDYFENYKEYYGHAKGDSCLILMAKMISELLHRPTDVVVRYNGEKFVIILPNTDIQGARFIANEMINQFAKEGLPNSQSPQGIITVRTGLASFATSKDGEDILTLANQRLSSVKSACQSACA
ncbi:diguanylate cyclase [uncultured Paraglaciecola sp.]|uniref:diguanylate cyclase domain-containing protein n=1 Tax=uncultured Paraglaciecola sp. TaxID=1765024 RepID=UPI0025DAC8B4|nr:diguanylate cyclase [uncultured Paraglaciecola sp.]